jgi:hypothetical protein
MQELTRKLGIYLEAVTILCHFLSNLDQYSDSDASIDIIEIEDAISLD